ncbi:hypothetical protein GM658_28525 [Pseudoduganella eburnea]|uniref:Uncharacterized protein n=1 Tax=Massilia eburnea TaxID=1776165 RepID=A0A6L6QSF1_9BURK|nr:hypothetical protein [Massilia eburnea]MTW14566.1 hypothetical protein [Massilia eburnea]
MDARAYSAKKDAAWIFSDLLNLVARRGWFSAGPSADDGKSLLYASFHVHPDDSDAVSELIERGILAYGGRTVWVLEREKKNRFLLCPAQVELKARVLNNFGKATEEVHKEMPELEREAAVDLILLSDFLYKSHVEKGSKIIASRDANSAKT